MMLPILTVAVLFGVVFTFTDMSVVYLLTRGGPYNSTHVLASLAFQDGVLGGDVGRGAAVAIFLLPGAAVLAIVHAARFPARGGLVGGMRAVDPHRGGRSRATAVGHRLSSSALHGLRGVPVLLDGGDDVQAEQRPLRGGRQYRAQPVHLQPAAHARAPPDAVRADPLSHLGHQHAAGGRWLVVGITLVLAVPAGYSLARLAGRWGERLSIGIFLTYLVPSTLLFIPFSRLVSLLGLQNSSLVPGPHLSDLHGALLHLAPHGLLQIAAQGGGGVGHGGRLQPALARSGAMVLPLSLPGILTVVIFALTLVVQEFVYSLTFISSVQRMTVSVGVPVALMRGDVYYWGSLMAACVITSLPMPSSTTSSSTGSSPASPSAPSGSAAKLKLRSEFGPAGRVDHRSPSAPTRGKARQPVERCEPARAAGHELCHAPGREY